MVGAAAGAAYAIDLVWAFRSGTSLLPNSTRYMSLETTLTLVAMSLVFAVASWRLGRAARDLLNPPAPRPRTRAGHDGEH